MKLTFLLLLLLPFSWANLIAQSTPPQPPTTPIQSGDRVAWIGGELFEAAQEFGWLESETRARLALLSPPILDVSFRNLGWSGDDLDGRARAVFGSREAGYDRRLNDLQAAKPTLVILAYGTSEAFDDSWNPQRFSLALEKLLADLTKLPIRLAIALPPLLHEQTPLPTSRLPAIQTRLGQYRTILAQVAADRHLPSFALPTIHPDWSDDGLRLHPEGQHAWAQALAQQLVPGPLPPSTQTFVWDVTTPPKTTPRNLAWNLDPVPNQPFEKTEVLSHLAAPPPTSLVIRGLTPGRYRLSRDNQPIATLTDREWAQGRRMSEWSQIHQMDQLRTATIEKDLAFFHRYRPQNETYLFLFRKHEQGNNANEVHAFDALANESDSRIRSLLIPKSARWKIEKVGD